VAFAGLSALLHIGLSHWFYYGWVMERPGIDGGPLGFLTWTLPMLAGSLAYDLVMQQESRRAIAKLLGWGFLAMLAGYAIACLSAAGGFEASRRWQSLLVAPPFVPPRHAADMWTMSQRAGSVSYLMFGSGFSLAVYALFVLVCDVGKIEWGVFRTLGTNALAAYIIHDFVAEAIKPLAPSDAPVWFVLTVTAIFLIICYVFLRHLEKNKLFLRL
jgi:hypothetical protein